MEIYLFNATFELWKYDNTFIGDLENAEQKHIITLYITISFK